MTIPTETTATPAETIHALKFPFTIADGTVIEALKLRRAKARDLLAVEAAAKVSGSETSVTLAYLASVNNMSADDIGEIDAEDLVDLGEMLADFLPESMKAEPEA